jgi:hypothetical protein
MSIEYYQVETGVIWREREWSEDVPVRVMKFETIFIPEVEQGDIRPYEVKSRTEIFFEE